MSRLRELEKRLVDEPDNLGLRVAVAGALREAGRQADAIALYRSVALAYRDQGRSQQALAVCRSILELAPDDAGSLALVAALGAALGGDPVDRESSSGITPLPAPLAHHEADPTYVPSGIASAARWISASMTGSHERTADLDPTLDEGLDADTVERLPARGGPADDGELEDPTLPRVARRDSPLRLPLPPPPLPPPPPPKKPPK